MRLIILGAPGSGKGSQCKWITRDYDVPHISTGDILRKNISEGTVLGQKAKSYIDQGALVPDELVIDILKARLNEEDCKEKGFLLDGFPRTISQAEALEEFLEDAGVKIDKVINLHVPDEEIMARAINRRTCENSECKEIYNLRDNPPKVEGICDKCGSNLFQRADDNEETVKNRLMVYHNQTEPLIEFYTKKNLLATIIGQEDINDTIALVKAELAK
ncbi:MAG: adenylate kinase [Clostridia bacterium]|nr:adenylate kinase [Clostridia bacterium]